MKKEINMKKTTKTSLGLFLLFLTTSLFAQGHLECEVHGTGLKYFKKLQTFSISPSTTGSEKLDVTLRNGELKQEVCTFEDNTYSCHWGSVNTYALSIDAKTNTGNIRRSFPIFVYPILKIKCF